MKKLSLSLLLFVGVLAASCTSDDSSNATSSAELTSTITSGTWYISLFKEGDTDRTANFANYDFTFGEANVLTATDGTNTNMGFWAVNDDDSSSDVDLDISFTSPANFTELSEDWDILERTNNQVRLRHVSGGDGSTDLLTFSKN